ncbi:MAG: 30S ribosomal protein S4 [Pseudomonadota bacterium]
MTKRVRAKYKVDRRLGVNLWGRPKSPFNKRDYPPGPHGQQRRSKPTDYGIQLMAKQKMKSYYANISERQFRRYYQEASRRRGDTIENLVGLLESRLDAIVYRAKFVPTMYAARQFVNHGHVEVNGRRVNIASARLREGDEVSVRSRSREMAVIAESILGTERDQPDYVSVDTNKLKATLVRIPAFEEVPYPAAMEPNLVIEYYSR